VVVQSRSRQDGGLDCGVWPEGSDSGGHVARSGTSGGDRRRAVSRSSI